MEDDPNDSLHLSMSAVQRTQGSHELTAPDEILRPNK